MQGAGLFEEVKDNLTTPRCALSGGQQQRLCIARSLAVRPEVLLLDEPCSALDPISTAVIEEQIVKLRDEVAIVIVTHNLQQAQRVADRVGFMYSATSSSTGPPTRSSETRRRSARASTSPEDSVDQPPPVHPRRNRGARRTSASGRSDGCESTQDKSARAEAESDTLLEAEGVKLGEESSVVEVLQTQLNSRATTASPSRSSCETPRDEILTNVPLLFDVVDDKGKTVFTNDATGIDQTLTSVPVMDAGAETVWVHDQVFPTGQAADVKVQVGEATEDPPGEIPPGRPHPASAQD